MSHTEPMAMPYEHMPTEGYVENIQQPSTQSDPSSSMSYIQSSSMLDLAD